MTNFPFATIGFDLDGTLVDSNLDLLPAMNHTLELAGRSPLDYEQSKRIIGGGTREMLQRALLHTGGPIAETEMDALLEQHFTYYEAHLADNTVPFDGVLATLDNLRERGVRLALVTNKIERFARKLVEALDMIHYFDCVIGGDTLGPGRAKPAPDMVREAIGRCGGHSNFVMVGDSRFDVEAAHAAGVPCVAVTFGYRDRPAEELGADRLIDHYDQLIPALEQL
ncbi:HAD-IA family hydrolase [Altericroceibacterium endophyticum]|uniref:Phosphoglycolate phosphatase n=1 Tax=Altericroceibacterium endophyticum TaxID=1808508 RepID=A0A6I4T8E0_9SPHN|nr:HAD-IA family hydrolase [Altericroceibacterium endophyticum]MXO66769.1 HAD-IA family hydrolase [Altericroceibacterium endophyticum]